MQHSAAHPSDSTPAVARPLKLWKHLGPGVRDPFQDEQPGLLFLTNHNRNAGALAGLHAEVGVVMQACIEDALGGGGVFEVLPDQR